MVERTCSRTFWAASGVSILGGALVLLLRVPALFIMSSWSVEGCTAAPAHPLNIHTVCLLCLALSLE